MVPPKLHAANATEPNPGSFYNPTTFTFIKTTLLCTMRAFFLITLLILAVLGVDVPLWLDGALQDATATDDTYNTGGTISVNGWVVNVPKNMIVTFPASFIAWKEFVAGKASVLGYEVNVSQLNTYQI